MRAFIPGLTSSCAIHHSSPPSKRASAIHIASANSADDRQADDALQSSYRDWDHGSEHVADVFPSLSSCLLLLFCRAQRSEATPSELCCPGGELSFLSQLFQDSRGLRKQIDWTSAMCGKKSTLISLRSAIASSSPRPQHIRTATFTQGKQTRWALAWSWRVM
jgi:RNA methyltransferase